MFARSSEMSECALRAAGRTSEVGLQRLLTGECSAMVQAREFGGIQLHTSEEEATFVSVCDFWSLINLRCL